MLFHTNCLWIESKHPCIINPWDYAPSLVSMFHRIGMILNSCFKKGFTRRKRSHLKHFIQSQSELSQWQTLTLETRQITQKSPPWACVPVLYRESRGRSSNFRLPTSHFRFPTSVAIKGGCIKAYTTVTLCQNATCSNNVFFLPLGRLSSGRFYIFNSANVV